MFEDMLGLWLDKRQINNYPLQFRLVEKGLYIFQDSIKNVQENKYCIYNARKLLYSNGVLFYFVMFLIGIVDY